MSEWQPIERAPRDGSELLLTDGERVAVWPAPTPGTLFYLPGSKDAPGTMYNFHPTHWMPLPDPPLQPE